MTDKPTYHSAGLNGLGTINFNAGTEGLATQNYLGITGGANRSMFAVMRRNDTGKLAVQTGGDATYTGWGHHFPVRRPLVPVQPLARAVRRQAPERPASSNSTRGCTCQAFRPAEGTNYGFINGTAITSGTNTGDIVTADGPVRIGYSSLTGAASGDIAEVLIFNRLLSDTERQEVEAYLTKKWLTASTTHFAGPSDGDRHGSQQATCWARQPRPPPENKSSSPEPAGDHGRNLHGEGQLCRGQRPASYNVQLTPQTPRWRNESHSSSANNNTTAAAQSLETAFISLGGTAQRAAVLGVTEPSLVTFKSWNMDSNPGWTFEGDWAWGTPAGSGGDPSSGHTGSNVVGYNLNGQHGDDMPAYYATTPAFSTLGHTNVTLSFWRWLGVEPSAWDHASIQVSRDGTNWTTVWENTTADGTIEDTAWVQRDLRHFSGC